MRKSGMMSGGSSPDMLRKDQHQWARNIICALCEKFREKDDADGRTGMEAAFYPTLKWLRIDPAAGTIHCLIVHMYTD